MDERNKEFFALIKASGWSAAEVARRLDMDRSNISQYKKGVSRPSSQTLKLFRRILIEAKPNVLTRYPVGEEGVETPDSPALREGISQLRKLESEAPETLKAALSVVATLYRSTPRRKRAAGMRVLSSKEVSARKALAKSAASRAAAAPPEPEPKPRVDEPSAGTSEPKHGAEQE